MFKLRYIFILPSLILYIMPVFSQTSDGLKDIISFQQEKISRIEDNLKNLVGLIEEQSNLNNANNELKSIKKQINVVNEKLRLFENKIKNIINLTYDLDFALKRVERHLDLVSIKSGNVKINGKNTNDKAEYKIEKKLEVKKKSLETKTDGVLGFIKEADTKDNKNNVPSIDANSKVDKNMSLLPSGTAEENFNFALNLANQLDFVNAEKAIKEFLIKHKENSRTADAQYWLGRVYFAQKKFEEATIALSEFNIKYPNDPRFQETTLLIARSAVNFASKDQSCNILNQLLENMIDPSNDFLKKINLLKNEKQCSAE